LVLIFCDGIPRVLAVIVITQVSARATKQAATINKTISIFLIDRTPSAYVRNRMTRTAFTRRSF
jgi:hypothetical protein